MDGDGFGSRSLYTSFGEKELVKIERRKEGSWIPKILLVF